MNDDASRILVTGASGFVGRHLTAALAQRGARVRASTRGIHPVPVIGAGEWVAVGRISGDTDWTSAIRGVGTVVHLAALAHQVDPRHQPRLEDYMEVNAAGSGRLAQAAARSGSVRRFIFVSSIGAVREASNVPVDEDTSPRPSSSYGRSKLAGEQAVREALNGTGTDWCILRPVLVYGPGNPGNMARLLRLVRTGVPLPLGGIQNRRSLVFVGNLADAIIRMVEAPGPLNGVFHVADDEVVSTPGLVRLVAAADGRTARLWPAPGWALRLAARCGDAAGCVGLRTGVDSYSLNRLRESLEVPNRALRRNFGWSPGTTLEEGLRATLSAR
jgi:nucleoside-diphosphate-sugar epimerase